MFFFIGLFFLGFLFFTFDLPGILAVLGLSLDSEVEALLSENVAVLSLSFEGSTYESSLDELSDSIFRFLFFPKYVNNTHIA